MSDVSGFKPYEDVSAAASKIKRTLSLFGKRFTYVAEKENTGFVLDGDLRIYKIWHDGEDVIGLDPIDGYTNPTLSRTLIIA